MCNLNPKKRRNYAKCIGVNRSDKVALQSELLDKFYRIRDFDWPKVPIATRLSICTPTIPFKMALNIDEAVSPAVVKTF